MYPRCLLTVLAATSIAMPSVLQAQQPPPLPAALAAGNGSMLATDRYLFVLRDDVLYQFDLTTLKLRHRFDFKAPKDVAGADQARIAPDDRIAPGDEAVAVEIHEAPQQASPAAVAASVDAALGWLAAHQDEDGRWDADNFMKHETAG